MKISFIVPMYNSAEYVSLCLEAIYRLRKYCDLQLISIDNGSSDDTVEIAKKFSDHVVILPDATIAKMRNEGVKVSRGELIAFIDSDCIVSERWLLSIQECFSKYDHIGAVGGYYGLGDSPGWVEQTWHSLKNNVTGDVSFLSAGNMVVRKKVFCSIGGFNDEMTTGEDWELCSRLIEKGYRVINCPELSLKHLGNVKTLSGMINKERWYGVGMFDLVKKGVISRTLIASVGSLLIFTLTLISLFAGEYKVAYIGVMLMLALVSFYTVYFIRNASRPKFKIFFLMLPLTCAYLIGRTLSVIDFFSAKLKRLLP